MMFWKKGKKDEMPPASATSATELGMTEADFEGKDVGLFSLFVPFVKNYASSMSKTKNPAKLPYPTCFYLPQSSLMHMVHLQMSHINLLIDASTLATPADRFLGVVKYCISTWSLTKFPYKPIISLLGETAQYSTPYTASADPSDKTYVLAENLRKDPPYSCYHITNPKHGVTYEGTVELDPKFKQAHVQVQFKGQNKTTFVHPGGQFREEYYSDIPDFIVRLLRMHQELIGEVNITSTTGFACKVTFKEKSLFGKARNQITGAISFNGAVVYTLDGAWDEIVYITDLASGQRVELINKLTLAKNPLEAPATEQQPVTSCDRVWGDMLEALRKGDFETAAQIKAKISTEEHLLLDSSTGDKTNFTPRYFAPSANGLYTIKDPKLAISLGTVYPTQQSTAGAPQV
jgi:hypothetical protein